MTALPVELHAGSSAVITTASASRYELAATVAPHRPRQQNQGRGGPYRLRPVVDRTRLESPWNPAVTSRRTPNHDEAKYKATPILYPTLMCAPLHSVRIVAIISGMERTQTGEMQMVTTVRDNDTIRFGANFVDAVTGPIVCEGTFSRNGRTYHYISTYSWEITNKLIRRIGGILE